MNSTTSSALNVPQTQNTAPVLEFRCLYTADLRRKQKRWQDGRLKFHTFNKRIMVYDERSNFVGDAHWKGSKFDEGEEFELERGDIMVEVGECIGKRDQDLSELLDKRVKDKEDRAAARAAQASPIRPTNSIPANEHPRPKTLNAVIGTPTGHYGRAMLSNLSPFEKKQEGNLDSPARPAKRRKHNEASNKNGYAQKLMGSTLSFTSSRPSSIAAIRYEPVRPTVQRTQANTIDLNNDDDMDQRPSRKSPPRIQKWEPKKSPPTKSGYASSLMGSAFILSMPSGTVMRDSVAAPKGVPSTMSDVEFDSPSPERMIIGKNRSDNLPSGKEVSNPVKREGQKAKSTTRHKDPPQQIPNPQSKVTKEPFLKGIPDRPTSTLRIKARAPRKMMMLMELPNPRSSAQDESLLRNETSRHHSRTTTTAEEAELPRISSHGIRTQQADRPTINLDDRSSSPIDSGIGLRTIDALLSSRRRSDEKQKVLRSESCDETQATTTIMQPIVTENLSVESAAMSNTVETTMDESEILPAGEVEQTVLPSAVVVKDTPKVVNPATRGQSVHQMLATKTLDKLTMQPPPVIIDGPPRSRGAERPASGNPVDQGGPWSRESFDLFGTWRPPDRSLAEAT